MSTWIALFRGINVGGNNALPMAKLKKDLEGLKLSNVQTYIQSGNVVFQSSSSSGATLAKKISDTVETEHGFRPHVLLLTRDELETAIERNPFHVATSEPTSLHFFFLEKPASQANLAGLEKIKAANESFRLIDKVFYLHAPDGVGRSKLAAGAEKLLGVVVTARNYRTVEKLRTMVSGV